MTAYILPATTYGEPSPPQARRKGRQLNTIMEEENEDVAPQHLSAQRRHRGPSDVKIEEWLSPLSDHFPTPRGFHFLAAPVLPSSPSAMSADDSSSPSPASASPNRSSNPWHRSSIMTDATEFDDLYDTSEDESVDDYPRKEQENLQAPGAAAEPRKALPPLVIPASRNVSDDAWSARAGDLKSKMMSPVAPTPTSGVAMSPAMVEFMQAQQALEVPTISAPPSLDGSLTSDQMAQMSAPPTPIIGGKDDDDADWSGVHLQPGALATLQALSVSSSSSPIDFSDQLIELPQQPEPPREEMSERPRLLASHQEPEAPRQPLRLVTDLPRASMMASPAQHKSLAGLTKLDIPSPGGFFSGLSPRSRHTWHLPTKDEVEPPTSGVAEQFYKLPWKADAAPALPRVPPPPRPLHMSSGPFSSEPIEQIVERPLKGKGKEKEEPLTALLITSPEPPVTARRVPLSDPAAAAAAAVVAAPSSSATLAEPTSPVEEVTATEIVDELNPMHARKQQEIALSRLDRTEMWLFAQRAYLKGVESPEESLPEEVAPQPEAAEPVEEREVPPTPPPKDIKEPELAVAAKKKTVRFSELVVKSPVAAAAVPCSLPSKLVHQESAYYRAFTDYMVRSRPADVFVSRMPRFEALQAQRVTLREAHHNQLLGKFQLSVVPQSAKKRMSANVVRGDDVLTDDPAKLRADKEADALSQMAMAMWHVAAWKLLSGGRLITAPVHKRLARLSRMVPGGDGVARDRARILDLGGQAACDWAWHAALAYPNTKIYTVTTKAVRQLSNSNIRGPPNHRQVAVERLTRLPFADAQFDLIRASELHAMLKLVGEHGEDEWDSCLRECMRVLKPGGYLEFSLLDADLVNAGKLGNAKTVEFGFSLKTLGYDPNPTKLFLGRLERAGFEPAHRAWMSLPVGPRHRSSAATPVARDAAGLPIPTVELEAMVSGSTDAIAAVTGLAAGWSWERWLLRAEMEKAAGELRLADIATTGDAMREARKTLEDVPAIVEEGRACGAAWRALRGYARKPRLGDSQMGFINMLLDTGSL